MFPRLKPRDFLSKCVILSFLAPVLLPIAQAEFESEGWLWEAPIESEGIAAGFVRMELTLDVLDQSQRSLHDLRILDETEALVPHVIFRPPVREYSQTWNPVQLINRTYQEGEHARVTLDFGERTLKNHVRVRVPGDNYRRYAVLEGSETGGGWETVDTTWLFRIAINGLVVDAETFSFPANDFRYLRLTVFNMEDEMGRIEIAAVETSHAEVGESERVEIEAAARTVEPEEDEQDQTIFDIDLGNRNLPIAELQMAVSTPYFYRAYELSGRDTEILEDRRKTETGWDVVERDAPWRVVRRGVLYRIQQGETSDERLSIKNPFPPYRYLRLRVFNGDDSPLGYSASDISATRRSLSSLVFENDPLHQYRLLFGNEKAAPPNYDLAHSVENVAATNAPAVTVLPGIAIDVIPDRAPWSERYSWAIWVVLIGSVGVVVGLIARNMGQLRPQ